MDFGKLKEQAQQTNNITDLVSKAKDTVTSASTQIKDIVQRPNKTDDVSETEVVEKGSKMLQVMDWAFDKANGNIPGFGTSSEMAQKYLEKNDGSISKAVDSLIRWQVTSAATTGFVTSLGGLPTMPITLPANVAGVLAIQLRMIGAIALLGGADPKDEDTKTAMYLCLLGAEASNVLSKTVTQFTVKLATASLKKLPGAALTKINQTVGFRLLTKFGEKGLVNIHKAIPILGGVVGGTIDALSTYGIANASKALFLKKIIDAEKEELLEISRMQIIINLTLIDGTYKEEEALLLNSITHELPISEKGKDFLYKIINVPTKQEVDLTPFKNDMVLACSLLAGMAQLAKADGTLHPAECLYIRQIGSAIGCDQTMIDHLLVQ